MVPQDLRLVLQAAELWYSIICATSALVQGVHGRFVRRLLLHFSVQPLQARCLLRRVTRYGQFAAPMRNPGFQVRNSAHGAPVTTTNASRAVAMKEVGAPLVHLEGMGPCAEPPSGDATGAENDVHRGRRHMETV